VVDNGSRDDSATVVATRFPQAEWLAMGSNAGYAAAANAGWQHCNSEWVLFLNPDAEVPSDLVARVATALAQLRTQRIDQLGMFGAKVLNMDGSLQRASHRNLPRVGESLLQMLLPGLYRPHHRHRTLSEDVWQVEALNGAFLLLPRVVLQRLNGFDAGYFLHCEDLDLFARATAEGYGIYLLPELKPRHLHGGSSSNRLFVERAKHRGMLRYIDRHLAPSAGWLASTLIKCGVRVRLWLLTPLWWLLSRGAR
jgi:N-acetylglucosaminyl-diphospho-decaprenol L-rhamnosyltransferase